MLVLILVLAGAVSGEDAVQTPVSEMGRLTLEDCIEIATGENFSLALKREALIRSSATRLGAWSQLMPNASLRLSWSHSGDDTYNITGAGLTSGSDYYSAGFSVSQPLFAGGNNLLNLKSSTLGGKISETEVRRENAELIFNVKQAFYTVIGAGQTEENMLQALERTRDQWVFVAQRDSLDLADPTEVSQMKVTLAETELACLQARNSRRNSVEALLMLLSFPLGDSLTLVEETEEFIRPLPLDSYISSGLESSPLILSSKFSRENSELDRMSSWSGYLPSVNASYSYNWSGNDFPGSFSTIDDEANWNVGVSASWTLFAGTSRISSQRSTASGIRNAEISLKQARQLVESSIRGAYRRMEESSARIDLAEARLQDANLSVTLFGEKYRLGDSTLLELLQAELALRKAEAEKVSAIFDYRTALAELERWSGLKTE